MGPPNNGFKVGHQFIAIEWFGQIAVRARPECGDFIIYPTIARNHQNWHRHMIFADQARQSGAISIG